MPQPDSRAISHEALTAAAFILIVACGLSTRAMPASTPSHESESQARTSVAGCASKPVISAPGNNADVVYTEIVKGTTTCSGQRHYVVVTPQNGVDYVQNRECSFPSRTTFTCTSVQFGEGRVGIGKQFNVRIVVVKDTLPPGPLQEIPADAVQSSPITVTRTR